MIYCTYNFHGDFSVRKLQQTTSGYWSRKKSSEWFIYHITHTHIFFTYPNFRLLSPQICWLYVVTWGFSWNRGSPFHVVSILSHGHSRLGWYGGIPISIILGMEKSTFLTIINMFHSWWNYSIYILHFGSGTSIYIYISPLPSGNLR